MANKTETAVRPVRALKNLRMLGPLLLAMLSACVLPDFSAFTPPDNGGVNGELVTITTGQLTLLWDVPLGDVDHYTVHYRVHGSSDWTMLADVPAAPQPEYTILHSVLGDGEFDFAVVTVDGAAQKSTYHTSLDTTAQPQTGGYVSWIAP
jgi:hypothetical protein